jgi:O-antigen ligase
MERYANAESHAVRSGPGASSVWLLLGGIAVVACTVVIVKPAAGLKTAGLAIAAVAVLYTVASTLAGRVEAMILNWVLLFPLGYYFVSFPMEKAVVTFDRLLLAALLLAMGLASYDSSEKVPVLLRNCALIWGMFVLIAGVSIIHSGDVLKSGRNLVDSFFLPAILGWSVIRNFRVRSHLASLHTAVSLMAIYVAAIGIAEMVLGEDLLPLPGSSIVLAGSLARPNGPFYTNDSFALIGLMVFFLLLFLWQALGEDVPPWRKWLHAVGCGAALAMGLMPMFRSVLITLMLILLLKTLWARKSSHRIAGFVLIFLCVAGASLISVLAPEAYEDRSRPDNFYVRLAEQMQTLQLFWSHPILGVGLGNFTATVEGNTNYMAFYNGVQSIDSPHNNLGGILSETGVIGFVPYVAAQVLLVTAFWKIRRRDTRDAKRVWTYFIFIFLCYWVNGMTLASGYNSDLNLWFVFAISVLYKFAMTDSELSWNHAWSSRLARAYRYV